MSKTTAKGGHEHVLEAVRDRTSPDPDGCQNNQSNLWAGRNRIRGDGSKGHTPLARDDVDDVVTQLVHDREIFEWHGLLTPATETYLKAVIENERKADSPRTILVAKVNRWLQAMDSGGDDGGE